MLTKDKVGNWREKKEIEKEQKGKNLFQFSQTLLSIFQQNMNYFFN